MTREDVEAEIERARRADEESTGYITEGQSLRSVEEGEPHLREADLSRVDLWVLRAGRRPSWSSPTSGQRYSTAPCSRSQPEAR